MPWFLTPHGPHFVVEPGTVDEYERRDYVEMTAQQVTDYYAGVAFPDPPSFATEAEVPGIVAADIAGGTGPVAVAARAASVAAVEVEPTVAPAGAWTFTTAPTVGGVSLGAAPPDATTTAKGIVELATTTEATTGTDAVRAVTPAGVKAVGDTKVALTGDQTVAGVKTLTGTVRVGSSAAPPEIMEYPAGFPTTLQLRDNVYVRRRLGIGGEAPPRVPFATSVTIDGSTLDATGPGNKVGAQLNVTFKGGFSGEAGFGVPDPGFLFGANDFILTGTATGDLAGVTDVWGRLSEVHIRTPGSTVNVALGLQSEANIDAEAVGATIAAVYSHRVLGPRLRGAATVANAYGLWVSAPSVSGTGTAATGVMEALHVEGTSKINGDTTISGGLTVLNAGVGRNFRVAALTPNIQAATVGVYAGVNSGEAGIELANGTNNWRIDNNASGIFRILRAGVQSNFEIDGSGHTKIRGGIALFNGTPITAKRTSSANATDLATAITLLNEIKADLQAIGLKA